MEKKATFGAGCFWGVEAAFRRLDGVTAHPRRLRRRPHRQPDRTSRSATTRTGHAEVVEVTYDAEQIPYEQLLAVFWAEHDPTQLNRQGPDVGDQYRSVIFVHDEAQRAAAEASRDRVQAAALAPGRDADRGRADLLGGRGLPPAVPREARARELHGPPRGGLAIRAGRFGQRSTRTALEPPSPRLETNPPTPTAVPRTATCRRRRSTSSRSRTTTRPTRGRRPAARPPRACRAGPQG